MLSGANAIDKEDLENGLNEFQVNEVIRCMAVTNGLETAIANCDKALMKLKDGKVETPTGITDNQEDTLHTILEERYEYLEEFRSSLDFLLNNENRDKMQV